MKELKDSSCSASPSASRRSVLAGLAALGVTYAIPGVFQVNEAMAHDHNSRRSKKSRHSKKNKSKHSRRSKHSRSHPSRSRRSRNSRSDDRRNGRGSRRSHASRHETRRSNASRIRENVGSAIRDKIRNQL